MNDPRPAGRAASAGTAREARETHRQAGNLGEEKALGFLEAKGYRLCRKNYRFGRGEIDLVMEDPRGVLVFVEVKANRSREAGHPLERIDARKIRQVQRVAQKYCWEHGAEDCDMRFDVVGVDLEAVSARSGAGIEHVENAFLPDGAGYHRP